MSRQQFNQFTRATLLFILITPSLLAADPSKQIVLEWAQLPAIPCELGLAGPIVGVNNGALIVAGGANFPEPIWESTKQWHDRIFVMTSGKDGLQWREAGQLPKPIAYAATVSTNRGILCMGGNDAKSTFDEVFLISWNGESVELIDYPKLPRPCAYGQATVIGNQVYLAGGQSASGLNSAMTNFWRSTLDANPNDRRWEELPPWPGPSRAFNLTLSQHNGFDRCVYVLSGRTHKNEEVDFLRDFWEFNPSHNQWRRRSDVPTCVMAGTGIDFGTNQLLVLGGADGSLFAKADELRDAHPGFPKQAFAYHTITDRWIDAGKTSANHVTTQAVKFDGRIVVPTGEVRPRVRSPKVWNVQVVPSRSSFGFGHTALLCISFAFAVPSGFDSFFSRSLGEVLSSARSRSRGGAGFGVSTTDRSTTKVRSEISQMKTTTSAICIGGKSEVENY